MKVITCFFLVIYSLSSYAELLDEKVSLISSWTIISDRVGGIGSIQLENITHPDLYVLIMDQNEKQILKYNSEKVEDINHSVNLKDYIVNMKKNKNNTDEAIVVQISDFDFLKVNLSTGAISSRVDGFDSAGAYILIKGKKGYYKIPSEIKKSKKFRSSFVNVFGVQTQDSELAKEMSMLPEVTNLIDALKKCVDKKDKECFSESFLEKSKYGYDKDKVLENFTRRFILDDPKTCEIYQKSRNKNVDDDSHLPIGIEKNIDYSRSKLWDSLKDSLSLNLNKTYVKLRASDLYLGYNEIVIFKKMNNELNCSNLIDVQVSLIKVAGKWYLSKFKLTSQDED